QRPCTCPPQLVSRYRRRISGPLLDRIDLFVDVPRVAYDKLAAAAKAEPSSAVAGRVQAARATQHERFAAPDGTPTTRLNAEMTPAQVRDFVQARLEAGSADLLRVAVEQLNLSARSFHRLLKLGRTIADLAGSEVVGPAHVAESIQYRERVE
ncbi:MAG: ATP-binding protein, partial [Gemmataceae bacterium]